MAAGHFPLTLDDRLGQDFIGPQVNDCTMCLLRDVTWPGVRAEAVQKGVSGWARKTKAARVPRERENPRAIESCRWDQERSANLPSSGGLQPVALQAGSASWPMAGVMCLPSPPRKLRTHHHVGPGVRLGSRSARRGTLLATPGSGLRAGGWNHENGRKPLVFFLDSFQWK